MRCATDPTVVSVVGCLVMNEMCMVLLHSILMSISIHYLCHLVLACTHTPAHRLAWTSDRAHYRGIVASVQGGFRMADTVN